MSRELDLIDTKVSRRDFVPFFTFPDSGATLGFRYWPPGSSAGAHEHTAWTITAVCRNKLAVKTYDRERSYREQRLVPKNLFDAPAGRTGFIYEPCIHDPSNPTGRWSLSLHVTSPRDGERDPDDDMCLPALERTRPARRLVYGDARDWVNAAKVRHNISCQLAAFLAAMPGSTADRLLARCVNVGPAATRRFAGGRLPSAAVARVQTFTHTHQDLKLSCRDHDDYVALGIEVREGWVEQLRMARVARQALAFCASAASFAVDEIPGPITAGERWEIVDSLEAAGLVWQEAC